MKNIAVILICILIINCKPDTKKTIEKPFDQMATLIDQYANDILKKGNVNSISYVVYKNGEVYSNYIGEIDNGTHSTPNDNTLFEIASITKIFTGSLAARAATEKKISLDDDIRKYLKKNEYPNLEFKGTPITIKNLLTHTIGLKNRTPKKLEEVNKKTAQGYYKDKPFEYNIDSLLEELKLVKVNKKPGTIYDYNSVGPEIVAYILEKVYHKPYKKILTNFLNELDMKNTYLQDYDKHKKHLFENYNSNDELAPLDENPLLGGAYGIITTLPDLMKFMKFQLESNDPLIKESTRILFHDKEEEDSIGYLWEGIDTADEEGFYYSKTGTSNSTQSSLLLCPDSNYGKIIIVNNKTEASLNDWRILFNKIETDLIKYPKINLLTQLKPLFLSDISSAKEKFHLLNKQTEKYFNTDFSRALNSLGYDLLLGDEDVKKAIEIFEYAVTEFPKNANIYYSLGEAYYNDKNYTKALINYQKSLELNPENKNAIEYITEIKQKI